MKLLHILCVSFCILITGCGGGGDESKSQSITPAKLPPLPVLATSYQNKNDILLDNPTISLFNEISGLVQEGTEYFSLRAVAFADFTQVGSYSAITVSSIYKNVYPNDNPLRWADSPGKVYILNKDVSGKWQDVSSQLIKSGSRYVCITAGFIEIADLNNDKKPDAVISCTGPDYTINGVWDDTSYQYVVLSQLDGTYKVVELTNVGKIYAHQTALVDLNEDGNIDILSVDPYTNKIPVVLWGNGHGAFTLDNTRFPLSLLNKTIYSIRAIPINGKINVVVSGFPNTAFAGPAWSNNFGTQVLQYENGAFSVKQDLTAGLPYVSNTTLTYGLPLDVIYKNGYYYTYRVNNDYTWSSIVKTDAATGLSTLLYEVNVTSTTSGNGGNIKPTSSNTLVNQMAGCSTNGILANNYYYSPCTMAIPM